MRLKIIIPVIGLLLIFLGISLLFPLITSIIYKENDTMSFVYTIILSISLGLFCFFKFKKEKLDINHKDSFTIVSLGWIIITGIGCLPFLFSGVTDNFTNAYFETMSGFTTTGASIFSEIEKLPHGILLWRSLMQWLGGMGIILLSIAILPMLGVGGMQLFKAEVPGVTVDKISPRISETARTLWLVYLLLTLIEIFLLSIGGMPIFDSICHSLSTLSTGGFSPKNISIEHYNNMYFDIVITVFMLLSGINFLLHYKLLKGEIKNCIHNSELQTYIFIFFIASAFITIDLMIHKTYSSWGDAIRYSTFQLSSIVTTTGFSNINWEGWPPFSQFILVVVMFIGGMAGSTAGGMKVVRIMIIIKYAYKELYDLIHPHAISSIKIDNKPINREIIQSVLSFFTLIIFIFIVSSLILTFQGIDIITSFSAVSATLCNIGPGLNLVGAAHNYNFLPEVSKWVLIVCMLIGRLELYTVLILFVPQFWEK